MPIRKRRIPIGAILLTGAAVLWSLNGLFVRSLHNSGLSGWTIAGYRSLFACLSLTPFIIGRTLSIREPLWVGATVLTFTAMCATFVNAMTSTTVANAIVLQYTAPAWVFLISPFITREHATSREYISLVFALIGVCVIFGWQYESDRFGLILGLFSGLVFGVQTVLFRRVRAVEPMQLVWIACGVSAVLLLATAYATTAPVLTARLISWLAVMGLIQFALPYILFSHGLQRLRAQKGTMFILLEPLLSPVWVWLFLSEVPHVSTLVGGALILMGVLYTMLMEIRKKPLPTNSVDA